MNNIDIRNVNVLVLAYLGDNIYEYYVRKFLINKNAVNYVSAVNQAKYIKELLDNNFFTEEELDVIRRARNHKSGHPKSCDIITYKYATALEAVIGFLELSENRDRIEEIMSNILGGSIC